MVSAITKEMAARKKLSDSTVGAEEKQAVKEEARGKIMGSTTRIIHDGTFHPLVSLFLAIFVQLLLVALILASRSYDQFTTSRPGAHGSPFHGSALMLGILCTFLSQSYVGPPLRLHYNGLGEIVSAFLLAPVSFLFGILGHYTAAAGRSVSLADTVTSSASKSSSGCYLDKQVWCMFACFYCYQQARVLIMHIHDIEADTAGGKITFCVRVGRAWASRCYLGLNLMCGVFTYMIFQQLKKHQGMVIRIAGKDLDWNTAEKVGRGWKTGAVVIATYAVPVVLVTTKSLFNTLNKAENKPGVEGKRQGVALIDRAIHAVMPSWIPKAGPGDLATLVSIASLFTPVVLSLVLTTTVKVVGTSKV